MTSLLSIFGAWMLVGWLVVVVKGLHWGFNDPRHGLGGWPWWGKVLFVLICLLLWPVFLLPEK